MQQHLPKNFSKRLKLHFLGNRIKMFWLTSYIVLIELAFLWTRVSVSTPLKSQFSLLVSVSVLIPEFWSWFVALKLIVLVLDFGTEKASFKSKTAEIFASHEARFICKASIQLHARNYVTFRSLNTIVRIALFEFVWIRTSGSCCIFWYFRIDSLIEPCELTWWHNNMWLN